MEKQKNNKILIKKACIIFIIYIVLIKYILSDNLISNDYKCPRDKPLFDIVTNSCVYEFYQENKHLISNDIIKEQWLNRRNYIGIRINCIHIPYYMNSDFNSNGDLIIASYSYSRYVIINKIFIYGIKSNGRALFYNENINDFTSQIGIKTDLLIRFESQLTKINLVGDDEKDYYISFPNHKDYYIDIIDIYNKIMIKVKHGTFFEDLDWSSKYISILELVNEDKTYLFCFLAKRSNSSYLYLQKFQFYNIDLSKNQNYQKIYSKENLEVKESYSITCFEIVKYNLIECFYINLENYLTLGLFNESNLELILNVSIDDRANTNNLTDTIHFYKSILFKNEISILCYILDTSNYIYLQIKNIIFNKQESTFEIENYLNLEKLTLNLNITMDFGINYNINDLIKINNQRFILTSSSKTYYELYIVVFDINESPNIAVFIRYYKIPLKLYHSKLFLASFKNYNGFLSLILASDITQDTTQLFSILSYINGIDSETINLEEGTTIKLKHYINDTNIENNVFGVEFYGIKIIKLPSNENGVFYISKEKNNTIIENDILNSEDEIILIYDYEDLKIGNEVYTIEIAGVVKEPLYLKAINYTIYNEYYGNISPEEIYQPEILIGKVCFYNYSILNNITGKNDISCKENCKVYYNNICLKCKSTYILENITNICQSLIPREGYYYDENFKYYRKCYESCKTCSKGPKYSLDNSDIEEMNCIQCPQDFYKLDNTNNCYHKDNPPKKYFFNNEGFSKCYENCMTCSQYKKNNSYYNCLSCDENYLFYQKSTNCLNCVSSYQYVNYYQYKCINSIPDGYYLLNEETKEIDLCYKTCKHCNIKGDINNHKCLECSDAYPYNYKNGSKCLDDCSKENLYADFETQKCYIDCKENDNNRKYNYKNECRSKTDTPKNYILDSNNNFISLCNPQTEYEFNNECYKNCPDNTILDNSKLNKNICKCKNLYYLNGEDEICINSNVCPNDYPYLKIGSSECTNCPVKYNGTCYLTCPENTCITQINENLAICVKKLDDTKILGGICFDDFLMILDNVEGADSNTNIVINNSPGVIINIYQDDLNLDEIKKNNNDNLTFIDLDQCGEELRKYYKLKPEEKLYIISVDFISKKSNRVTKDNAFEIYLKNGTELYYKIICKNLNIYISSPIIKLKEAHFNEAVIFNLQGYNIYDLSSEFYNDKCTSANINGNDIIIKDRLIDIYPSNISICPDNCHINLVELELKRFNCSCELIFDSQEEKLNNTENNLNNQMNDNFINYLLDNINYKIFGCYIIILQAKLSKLINNIGFILGFSFIIFNLFSFSIFSYYYLSKIKIEMLKIIFKYNKKGNENNPPKKKITKCNKIKKTKSKSKTKKKKYKKNIMKQQNKNNLRKIKTNNKESINLYSNSLNKIELSSNFIINDDKIIDSDNYNDFPFTKALRLDKRNIFSIYLSIIKMKIEIISILFYPEEYTYKILTLSFYLFDFIFNYFINALLYSDEIVSKKYHNNGKLDLFVSINVSLISNIISFIILWVIKFLCHIINF